MSLPGWGLIPSSATDPSIGFKTINLTSETFANIAWFREPFRRCLFLHRVRVARHLGNNPQGTGNGRISDYLCSGERIQNLGLMQNFTRRELLKLGTAAAV